MDKAEARGSVKRLNAELFSLNPSAVMTFYTFDLTDLLFEMGLIGQPTDGNLSNRVFKFHNNMFMTRERLVWQGADYNALPLETEGFELSSQGSLPTPKLRISVDDKGISVLSTLKAQIHLLEDPAGIRVTRQRTLAKYLDDANFSDEDRPAEQSADPNAEFPRDIFFIERISQENKRMIEFQLSSVLDLENIRLPARMMIQQRCMWFYRGEGCSYEYAAGLTDEQELVHGAATLPTAAPPVATIDNELFSDILVGEQLLDRGAYFAYDQYDRSDYVHVMKNGVKYYFVCVATPPAPGYDVSNLDYWTADACSKSVEGCKRRWQQTTPFLREALPFGGFPGLGRIR